MPAFAPSLPQCLLDLVTNGPQVGTVMFSILVDAFLRFVDFLHQRMYGRESNLQVLLLKPIPHMIGLPESRHECIYFRSRQRLRVHSNYVLYNSP